jgi:regulator of sigma E protease
MANTSSTLLKILEFILAFGALVFFHEFGHFIFAKLNKIDVEEFGLGMRPRMLKLFVLGGTLFSLNWIPFGGFCQMKGENGETSEKGSFLSAKPWRRLLTLLGGPVTNLLIGMFLIAFIFTRTGSPNEKVVQIIQVTENTPAATANLQPGDIITEIDGIMIDGFSTLSQVIQSHLDQPVQMTIERNGQTSVISITPRSNYPTNQGPLGITISNPVKQVNFIQAIPPAFLSTVDQGVQLIMVPVRLISGQIAPSDARMVSVKGIYDIFSKVQTIDQQEAAQNPSMAGLNILSFFALISIALGFTNLLPIPALDGGRILFVLPELLFKKKIKPELEGKIHMIGYVILMILMVVLVINDIVNPIVLK